MKVLFVTHAYPPASRGGVETYTQSLALALRRAGAEPAILARRAPEASEPDGTLVESSDDGLPLWWISRAMDRATDFTGLYRSGAVDAAFSALLARERPAVVHFMHLTCLSTQLPALARQAGAAVAMTLHDYWPLCPRGQLLRPSGERCEGPAPSVCARCIDTWLALTPASRGLHRAARGMGLLRSQRLARGLHALNRARSSVTAKGRGLILDRLKATSAALAQADLLIAPSKDLAERYRREAPDLPAATVSPYGFDLSALAPAQRPRPGAGPLRVGFVGSLIPSKGPDLLLEAAAQLPATRFSVELHGAVVPQDAEPAYGERLRRLAASSGARLCGPFAPAQRAEILRRLDLLVLPSRWWENAPLTIQEAWAAKLPVLASDLGGMAELLARGGGFTFVADDAGDLARQLRRLGDSPDLLRAASEAAPQPRDIDDDARWHLARYSELVAAPGQRTGAA